MSDRPETNDRASIRAGGSPELVVIGNACVDLFVPPHAAPPAGGIVWVPPLGVEVGGNGANTAVTAARLGVRTAFAGTIGGDLFGRHVVDCLARDRVDISLLDVIDELTGPTTLVVNDASGERSFVHHPGSNAHYALPARALASACEVFHFAAPELLGAFFPDGCVAAARELERRGRTLSLDVIDIDFGGRDPVATRRPLLELVDMIFPNEAEARAISGRSRVEDMLAYFHDLGIRTVVLKRGAEGAIVSSDGMVDRVPTDQVRVVDTCGAGDNFVAGFLAAHLRGLSPFDGARLGCALGTLCVEEKGAVAASADPERLAAVLARFALV